MIALGAIVTFVLAIAGKQAGVILYKISNPEKTVAVTRTKIVYQPVVRAKSTPEIPPEPAPVVVKKVVPKVVKKKPLPRPDAAEKSPVSPKSSPVKDVAVKKVKQEPKEPVHPNTILLCSGANASSPAIDTSGIYSIQTGVYTAEKNADDNMQTFIRKGYDPTLVILTCDSGKKIYAVRIGAYKGMKKANAAFAEFKRKDPHQAIIVPLYRKKDMMSFCN